MVFNPNPSMPWLTPYPGGGHRSPVTDTAPVLSGSVDAPPSSGASPQQWDAYLAQIQAALTASSGFDRWKVEQQYEDAKKGRDNAYRIAQLQAENSRYGIDVNRDLELKKLEQQQAQYESNHALELQKFGLNVAEAYTKYASTPDMRWSAADFDSAVQRVGLGQGVAPISTNPSQPQAKRWEDFAALSGFETLPAVQANVAGGYSTSPMRGGGAATTDANGDGVPDARIKAARAIVDAIPPSDDPGNTDQDWAALNAVRSLYFAGRPGSLERLGPARRKIAQAGMARLGYDPNLVEEDYQRGLPGQQSVRAY